MTDSTERWQVEEHRQAHICFLECLDRVNRVMHQVDDVEQMPRKILEAVSPIFGCDRIWLLYPCDPKSQTYRIPVEVVRPEYPGANFLNLEVPMQPGGSQICAAALAAEGPVQCSPHSDPPVFKELTDQFRVRSQISMAIYPRTGKPWMLGMHQCAYERAWTEYEQRLFEAIGRRIGDGLSALLLLRDLQKSQERFELAEQRTAKLRRINAELDAANKELEAFAYTVSHDLRTPLTPIIGCADYLKEQYHSFLDDQALSLLTDIATQGQKMLVLMEDLLTMAKVGHILRPARSEPSEEIFQEVLSDLNEKFADAADLVQLQGSLPCVRIPRTLLAQVFANLIGNALRYAGREGCPIEVSGERWGDRVRFSVRDHGPGIPAKEQVRIFEVFYRGSTGTKSVGTGLGLAIVAKIASHYGGKAWLEDAPGGGCTFRVEVEDSEGEEPGG